MYNLMMTALAGATGPTLIPIDVANNIGYALMIVMVLLAVALIIVVMMQKSGGEDMSAIAGGSNKNDSFLGKNKSKSSEGKLRKLTVIFASSMLVVSIAYFVILSL